MNLTNIFCCFYVLMQWWLGMEVFHTPDSSGYIDFSPSRTVGYPLFLSAFKLVTGSFTWLPHFQLALIWASIGYVAQGLPNYLRLPWLLGMVGVSYVMKQFYCLEIMAEPLFITLLLTWAGLMLHKKSVLGMGLCVGGLILLRPVAYAALPAYIFYIWCQKESWLKSLLPLVGCFALGIGTQALKNNVWSTQSFLGHNLIGKVAFVVTPEMKGTTADQDIFIQRMATYLDPIQKEVAKSPSEPIRYFLAAPVYDVVRFQQNGNFEKGLNIEPNKRDDFWKKTALEIIKQNPLGYIKDVWMNWQALWFIWDFLPEEQRVIRNLHAEKLKILCPEIFSPYEKKNNKSFIVNTIRIALTITLLLSILNITKIIWKKKLTPSEINSITLSLAVNGILLLTAMLQAGLPRYALIFWPYFGLIVLLSLGNLYEKYRCSRSVL